MKLASEEHWYTWEQGEFVGANKPTARVVLFQSVVTVDSDVFHTLLFSNPYGDQYYEVPEVNIKSLSRNHRIGTDSATMSLVIRNAEPITTGEDLDESYDLDPESPTKRELHEQGKPGKFTYRRGVSSDGSGINPWGHEPSELVDMFLPNRVIRTYEGYGTDGHVNAWEDEKQVHTGTWLIDRVQIDASGLLTVECRDLTKLLIEQRLYPPIVPLDNYPVTFCGPYESEEDRERSESGSVPEILGPNIAKHSPDTYDSSAAYWYGTNANVFGHKASHAFDGNDTSYWISMRNSLPNASWSYEWIDADCGGEPVNKVRFRPWKGNYVLYVGVKENGVWQGDGTVPYDPIDVGKNRSNQGYVATYNMPDGEDWFDIDLPRTYNADEVRLTFTNLQDFGKIANGDYRAGVYEFQAMGYTPPTTTTTTTVDNVITSNVGNITDYTDIVKLFLAWAGFYWADGEDDPLFLRDEWGAKGGRVWGDFFYSGAYPIDPPCIDPSYWDNKSVMDAINQVKETLGFLAYVDATGGFVFRPPNIWANGNYVTGTGYVGEVSIPIVTEKNLLIDYGVTIDDAALRSEIVVISADDPTIYGSFSPGYASGEETPVSIESNYGDQVVTDLGLLAGQQRVMLVPDYPFGKGFEDEVRARAEVEKFAYLVSLWIHWSYRKARLRIPANPALDVDDQIRVYEPKTSENYIHYILGMNVTLDMDSGSYVADIDTHWLGNGPEASWHMFLNELPPSLLAYLCQQGILDDEICGNDGTGATPWVDVPPNVPNTPIEVPRTPSDLIVPYPTVPIIDWSPSPDYIPPSPGNPGQVIGGGPSGCDNSFMFAYWGNHYQPAHKARFYGASGTWSDTVLDNRAWPAFRMLSAGFIAVGIEVESASGKNRRPVRGVSSGSNYYWSNHSWGAANDVNHAHADGTRYLYWGKSIFDHPTAIRNKYMLLDSYASAIRALDDNGKWVRVFQWGEGFSKKDPMHWQICAPAKWLANGLWNGNEGPFSGPQ